MSRDRTDLLALVERFGTPLYVYDLARVRRAHRDLAAALPTGTVLHYSLKANPHPRLLGNWPRWAATPRSPRLANWTRRWPQGWPPGSNR